MLDLDFESLKQYHKLPGFLMQNTFEPHNIFTLTDFRNAPHIKVYILHRKRIPILSKFGIYNQQQITQHWYNFDKNMFYNNKYMYIEVSSPLKRKFTH